MPFLVPSTMVMANCLHCLEDILLHLANAFACTQNEGYVMYLHFSLLFIYV
jgi:hypothetical protein